VAGVIGLVAAAFVNRLKTFFNTPETAPVIGMVMAPATPRPTEPLDATMVKPEQEEPAASPGLALSDPGPALPGGARPPALLRGLTRLAATARRAARRSG
jgi:hypothetical protein